MKRIRISVTLVAVVLEYGLWCAPLCAAESLAAAEKAPVVSPSAGLINDWLRREAEGWKAWDVGGQFRVRHEVKENAGLFPNRDFIRKQDNDNDYLLERLRYESSHFWLDAFAGRMVVPYDGRFAVANDYDWLFGLYSSIVKLIPWQETQLYFLSRNVGAGAPNAVAPGVPGTPTTARDIYTIGTRWASLPGTVGGWDYSLEAAGQFGSINQSSVRRDQESYAVFASGGYSWKKTWGSPRLGLGYEFGSGDSNPNDGKNETFENLFGTNHRFYGAMDLFCQRNMHIPRLCASLKPVKNLTLSTEYLLFWLADTRDFLYPESGSGRNLNGYGRHPGFDSFVGSEIDIVGTYTVKKLGDLQLGYGHFFVGNYIKESVGSVLPNGGAVDANWFYVQARFNF